MDAFAIFGMFAVFLILRVPIAIACGLTGIIYMLVQDMLPLTFGPLSAFQGLDSFTLLAVPFFILAGQTMATGGIAKQLLRLADALLGAMPGGYALTTILASVFFADLSGSGPATVSAIGTIMIPAMDAQRYRRSFAAAVTACAGCIAVIIPPSNPMVIYGVATGSSVGRLFLAGIIPGAIVAISLLIPAYIISKKNGWKGSQNKLSVRKTLWEAKWALLVPVIILGGIYGGVATPTESAAVACLYAAFVGRYLYKEYTWPEFYRVLQAAVLTMVPIMFIISMAFLFGQVVTLMGLPARMAQTLMQFSDSPLVLLMLINLFLLFVGMVMDGAAAIILLAPILLPLAVQCGIDPVHFGIIMTINLAIGFITPPMGVNLFVANALSKVMPLQIFKDVSPFALSMLIALGIITVFPQISLFLPDLYYGK